VVAPWEKRPRADRLLVEEEAERLAAFAAAEGETTAIRFDAG
jgi:hypothetical protein